MRTKLTIDLKHFYSHLRSQKINYEVLKEFSHYLIYIPSKNAKEISINVKIERGPFKTPWGELSDTLFIRSISFEGFELIADEDEINVIPGIIRYEISKHELKDLLSKGYAIPPNKLNLIFNEDIGNDRICFNKNLKLNFRNR